MTAKSKDLVQPRVFRAVLGHYASGITVITGVDNGAPVGFTCQSFYSVSIEPPLVSFSVKRNSNTWPLIRPTGKFLVNVLSARQQHVSDTFARSGADRWAGIDWTATRSGNPVIPEALTWLDCEVFEEHPAGDHTIVIGMVREIKEPDLTEDQIPLVYFKGRYCAVTAIPSMN